MDFRTIRTIKDLEKVYPKHILDRFSSAPRASIYKDIPDEKWFDWKWQLQNRMTDLETIGQVVDLTDDEKKAFNEGSSKFKVAITPYYGSLMEKDEPNCPVRLQSVPGIGEMTILPTDMADPLAEDKDMPVLGLTHRYPDRVLFYVSHDCPMLCRHCTRKRKVAKATSVPYNKQIEDGLDYIRKTKVVRDVIVSGGDPLCLDNDRIDYILGELRKIPHIEVIRLGTRNPVTMPFRLLDDKLLEIIEKHAPIHVNTHYNHPKEMTKEALLACYRLTAAGAVMGNQTVLLKNVNDRPEIMKELCHKLLMMRVRPYYIFQCDMSEGISHFRTSIDVGVEILESLRGWTSGLANPYFVVDAPGGGGKIPMNPEYFVKRDGKKVTLRNFQKKEFDYFES